MAQLPGIGLSYPLTKPPFGGCAIYFPDGIQKNHMVNVPNAPSPGRLLNHCSLAEAWRPAMLEVQILQEWQLQPLNIPRIDSGKDKQVPGQLGKYSAFNNFLVGWPFFSPSLALFSAPWC